MKRIILIIFLAFAFVGCEKSETATKAVVALIPKVNLHAYDTQYMAGRNQFFMEISMENIQNVAMVELTTVGFVHELPLKTEKQIVWVAALQDSQRLRGVWKFTMKTGSPIYSEPFDVQY